jgi:ATP-dependent exoDNAse (exonuclease V) alpha subunit
VRAAAGTGKTYALDAAREAWQQSGSRVIGAALSARAACELRDAAGIESVTTARLLCDLERGLSLTARDVLVVDEAGMVGTRTLERLAAASAQAGAKLAGRGRSPAAGD